MKKVHPLAMGAVFTALSIVLLLTTGLFPFATYALPALSGMVFIVPAIELSPRRALMCYLSAALIAIFTVPDKEAAALFAVFLGHYPVTKSFLERLENLFFLWIAKLSVFSVTVFGSYFFAIRVFGIAAFSEGLQDFGRFTAPIFMAAAVVVFVLYDTALTRAVTVYIRKIRPRIWPG